MKHQRNGSTSNHRLEIGMGVIDSIITLGIVVIVITGVVELFAMAVSPNGPQPNAKIRTAEFARDKMDQFLRACGSGSSVSQRAEHPKSSARSAELPGCTDRLTAQRIPVIGGALDTHRPVGRYADYLDADGNPVPASARWEYVRVWQISVPAGSSPTTREIAIKAQARRTASNGVAPEFTIVTTRSFPLR